MSDLLSRHHAERARINANLPLLQRAQTMWERVSIKRHFSPINREAFYRKVSAFLEKGVPIRVIAERLQSAYSKRNQKSVEAIFYKLWLNGIQRGWSTSFVLSEFFPASEVMIIAAGEDSGDIINAFDRCAVMAIQTQDFESLLSSIRRSSLMYFGILYLLAIGFSASFQNQMARLFTAERMLKLGTPSRTFIEFTAWLYQHAIAVIVVVVLFDVAYRYIRSNYVGVYRHALDRYPPFVFYRITEGVGFLVALQALMESGKTLKQSTEVMQPYASLYTKQHLQSMQKLIRMGRTDGDAINTGLLLEENAVEAEIFSSASDLANSVPLITRGAIRTATRQASATQAVMKLVFMILLAGFIGWMFMANMGMGDAFKR